MILGFMAIWAIISALTGLAKNYTGMLILRFFLGVAEAPVSKPSIYIYVFIRGVSKLSNSIVLPWSIVHSLHILYPKRSCCSDGDILHR